jgi:hypothetical protein
VACEREEIDRLCNPLRFRNDVLVGVYGFDAVDRFR